jgi:hypothetical protein
MPHPSQLLNHLFVITDWHRTSNTIFEVKGESRECTSILFLEFSPQMLAFDMLLLACLAASWRLRHGCGLDAFCGTKLIEARVGRPRTFGCSKLSGTLCKGAAVRPVHVVVVGGRDASGHDALNGVTGQLAVTRRRWQRAMSTRHHHESVSSKEPATDYQTTLFRRLTWEGTVPLEIRVDPKELPANSDRGLECYYVQAPRVTYLPLLMPEIRRFLMDVVFDDAAAQVLKEEDWWFESAEGTLLKWYLPFSRF